MLLEPGTTPAVHHDRAVLQDDGVDFCNRLCICQSGDQQYAPSHFPLETSAENRRDSMGRSLGTGSWKSHYILY